MQSKFNQKIILAASLEEVQETRKLIGTLDILQRQKETLHDIDIALSAIALNIGTLMEEIDGVITLQ